VWTQAHTFACRHHYCTKQASSFRRPMQLPGFELLRGPFRWAAASFALLTLVPLMVAYSSASKASATGTPGALGIEEKLADLGITLPPVAVPVASYVPWTQSGKLLFLSGQIPINQADQTNYKGKVGVDFDAAEGYAIARAIGLQLIAVLQQAAGGDLDRIKQIIKVEGVVNGPDDFADQSKVINGCSDVLVEVFGPKGKHARVAGGTNSLPLQVPVEISLIAELVD